MEEHTGKMPTTSQWPLKDVSQSSTLPLDAKAEHG